jgi:hypothetical protein
MVSFSDKIRKHVEYYILPKKRPFQVESARTIYQNLTDISPMLWLGFTFYHKNGVVKLEYRLQEL